MGIEYAYGRTAAGATVPLRLNKLSELIVGDWLNESAADADVFWVCNQAGVTSQAGLSATTPVLTLYNPSGSGVNAHLVFAGGTYTVAFATAGAIFLAANSNTAAAATTGTATTAHRNAVLGGAAPVCTPLLAATLPAAPVAIDILGTGLTGAITTVPGMPTFGKWYSGSVILQPNTAVSIQTGVASGASGLFCTFAWKEVSTS
jgi:hypothetical protein